MSLREAEATSIRKFIQAAADDGYLSGRVLDYGCGKQPYRDIVEAAGGTYYGYDNASLPANVSGENVGSLDHFGDHRYAGAVLCTQVLQYVEDTDDTLGFLRWVLGGDRWQQNKRGHLVLTYPTNWPEVEPDDLHRFTKAGMELHLVEAGFEIIRHDFRHGFQHEGVSFTCGYGCIARA